jgi:dihydroorotate dehydrogenase (NAD+) catalytic subunit
MSGLVQNNLISEQNALSVEIAGVRFPSPILNASGAFNPVLFDQIAPLRETLGAIVTKTVTPQPLMGNPQYRTVELPGVGMLNSIGLQNPGLVGYLDGEASVFKAFGLPVILSISANSSSQFQQMVEALLVHPNAACVDGLEVNLSCPNVEKGGAHFGTIPEYVYEAISAIRQVWPGLLFAKLTPNVTDIAAIGEAAVSGGATGLTAINTVMGAAIDIQEKKPILKRVSGGYSGPGIKPIAVHAVWTLRKRFPTVPIMAVGGASSVEDILEFMMAGASLVQVGTQCFRQPKVFAEIHQQLKQYVQEQSVNDEQLKSISDIIGCAHA